MNMEELQNECWKACYHRGDLEFVKDCLSKGMDINARASISGAVPLDASLYGKHWDVFEYLLSVGADVNAVGYEDGTILMAASYMSFPDIVKTLLEHGADPNKASAVTGETPLHACAARGYAETAFEIMTLLLKAGAKPNVKAKNGIPTATYYRDITVVGETPLHLAAAYGSADMIKLLLDNGADPSLKDDRGDSPLTWYSRHQRGADHVKLNRDSRDLLLYGRFV